MKYNMEKHIHRFPNIKSMLSNIRPELWYIFLPERLNKLLDFEMKILSFKIKQRERNQVMSLQRRYGFSVRPNETLRAMRIKIKIKQRKNDKKSYH